mgnify:CR=1 FL=1
MLKDRTKIILRIRIYTVGYSCRLQYAFLNAKQQRSLFLFFFENHRYFTLYIFFNRGHTLTTSSTVESPKTYCEKLRVSGSTD